MKTMRTDGCKCLERMLQKTAKNSLVYNVKNKDDLKNLEMKLGNANMVNSVIKTYIEKMKK